MEDRTPPSLDSQYQCEVIGNPKQAALGIFLFMPVLAEILNHSRSDIAREVGGILVGHRHQYQGKPYIEIDGFIPAKHGVSRGANFTFTHDTWRDVDRAMDASWKDHLKVGWHHTHPSMGIFLSKQDLWIHENFFTEKYMVAMVVDPRNAKGGFFHWNKGEVEPCGFYIVERA